MQWKIYGGRFVVCIPMWIGLIWGIDTYWGAGGLPKRARLLEDEMILVRSNQQLAEQVNALLYRVQGLQQRSQVQQQVARDVLGWVHPQDRIVELDNIQ